jgi:uncharacterized protein YqfB (UPF0267 family)
LKNHVILFAAEFAPVILAKTKRQTIRRDRKAAINVGDCLELRQWADQAYRSKQVGIDAVLCTKAAPIELTEEGAKVAGNVQNLLGLELLAREDGFASWSAMQDWFRANYGLPFQGVLIGW